MKTIKKILRKMGFITLLVLCGLLLLSYQNTEVIGASIGLGNETPHDTPHDTPNDTPEDIEIYVSNHPSDTIIYQGDDYPEIAFVTVFALEVKGEKRELYTGPLNLKIFHRPNTNLNDYVPEFRLINLNDRALVLGDIEKTLLIEGLLRWQSSGFNFFYLALDDANSLKSALASKPSQATKISEINFSTNGKGYCTIAIASWNHNKDTSNLPFGFMNIQSLEDRRTIRVQKDSFNIALNVDNVDFARDKVEEYEKANPGSNIASFNEDPGEWIVAGTEWMSTTEKRRYSNIIEMKMIDARDRDSNLPIKRIVAPGGGIDSIQLAAIDFYGTKGGIFNSVFKIVGEYMKKATGAVEWTTKPNTIIINPFDANIKYNKGCTAGYGFKNLAYRDYVLGHEASHAYQGHHRFLQETITTGLPLYDNDNDTLVKEAETKNYFVIAEDSERRGFPKYTRDNIWRLLKWYLMGDMTDGCGDGTETEQHYFNIKRGYFVRRLDDVANGIDRNGNGIKDDKIYYEEAKKLFSNQPVDRVIKPDIPSDIPSMCNIKVIQLAVCDTLLIKNAGQNQARRHFPGIYSIYRMETDSIDPSRKVKASVLIPVKTLRERKGVGGSYFAQECGFRLKGSNAKIGKWFLKMLYGWDNLSDDKDRYRIYVIYQVDFKDNPYEYDAGISGITNATGELV